MTVTEMLAIQTANNQAMHVTQDPCTSALMNGISVGEFITA